MSSRILENHPWGTPRLGGAITYERRQAESGENGVNYGLNYSYWERRMTSSGLMCDDDDDDVEKHSSGRSDNLQNVDYRGASQISSSMLTKY